MRGPLIIISGPSGVGKSTVIRQILAKPPGPLRLAVSATTRSPRAGEVAGVDYHFWTREQFERDLARGLFLEHAVVHGRDYYGTLKSEVSPYLADGQGVLLDIDVQGASQIRQAVEVDCAIFLTASLDELERRIRSRGSEDAPAIARRLASAQAELAQAGSYHYVINNDNLDVATSAVREIIAQQFARK